MNTKKIVRYIGLAALALLATFALNQLAIGDWQFSMACLATAPLVFTEDQAGEFQTILAEIKGGWARVRELPQARFWRRSPPRMSRCART